jgi:hypothetical protein
LKRQKQPGTGGWKDKIMPDDKLKTFGEAMEGRENEIDKG